CSSPRACSRTRSSATASWARWRSFPSRSSRPSSRPPSGRSGTPVAELTADQRAQLTALRRAYAAELPEKVQMIARAAAAAGLHNWEADGVRQLHQLVHRLAGSAAIWGFIEVSRAANELEAIVL